MPDLDGPPELPAQTFACETRSDGYAGTWIRVFGDLDLTTAPRFTQDVNNALAGALLVVVDLRELGSVDATGLSAIVEAGAHARRSKRRLVFVRGPAQVERRLGSGELELIDVLAAPELPPSVP